MGNRFGSLQPSQINEVIAKSAPRYEARDWNRTHVMNTREAAASFRGPDHTQVVLIGDGLTGGWREHGKHALHAVLSKHWPSPLILGVHGDRSHNVLWRLTHGELPAHLTTNSQVLFSLLVGTHELFCCKNDVPGTIAGILAISHILLQKTRGRLLINALLPRAELVRAPRHNLGLRLHCVNVILHEIADQLSVAFPGRVGFIDCSGCFWANNTQVRVDLFWDGVHPSAAGYRDLATCLRDGLFQFLK